MLTVPTYLDRSSLHGIGIFSSSFLTEGMLVWEYHSRVDLTFKPDQWIDLGRGLSPCSFDNLRFHSYKEKGCLVLCLDNARFMNHSGSKANVRQDNEKDRMFASRDVEPGEELLCNYFEYSDCDDFHVLNFAKQSSYYHQPRRQRR